MNLVWFGDQGCLTYSPVPQSCDLGNFSDASVSPNDLAKSLPGPELGQVRWASNTGLLATRSPPLSTGGAWRLRRCGWRRRRSCGRR